MGCDTKLSLPPGAELQDVAHAIALLLGKPRTWYDIPSKLSGSEPTDKGWTEVQGISYKTSDGQPTCVTINIGDISKEYGDGWWLLPFRVRGRQSWDARGFAG